MQVQVSENRRLQSQAEEYYNSDKGFKFYSIVNSPDYSGIGLYPSESIETDHEGNQFPRGDGLGIREATIARNMKLLALIKQYAPKKKLKIIELGSGRGGFARQIACEL